MALYLNNSRTTEGDAEIERFNSKIPVHPLGTGFGNSTIRTAKACCQQIILKRIVQRYRRQTDSVLSPKKLGADNRVMAYNPPTLPAVDRHGVQIALHRDAQDQPGKNDCFPLNHYFHKTRIIFIAKIDVIFCISNNSSTRSQKI
jgi:hypothetical protein